MKTANTHVSAPHGCLVPAVTGNMVVFHDVESNKQTFLRSVSPGGIGAIAVHPENTYFAVAERGEEPAINVYEYPSMRLYRVLNHGARKGYSHITFNADGNKLASVASDPDYTLTVWEWKQEKIVQKSKAFSSDIWRVTFAAGNDEQLTTGGAGHIRFWKMASTFTGLKLQGDIGKFGRMEISDVGGFVELPDGKVVSGSEWGNMLLWEAGKIKCEIARKGKKPCHAGAIECVFCEDGEIMTAGADGHVRIWDLETIDLADAPSQEDPTFEMEPMMERKLANGVHIMSMIKSEEEGEDESQSIYFTQDKNGSIWKADMAHALTVKAPKSLLSFHAGKILGLDVCPVAGYAATTGDDGTVRVFDYVESTQMAVYSSETLTAGGTQILWAPTTVDITGRTFIAGFADGVLRRFQFAKNEEGEGRLVLNQVLKPHSKGIKVMSMSDNGHSLVTTDGSSLFFFDVDGVKPIEAIGFTNLEGTIQNIRHDKQGTKLLVTLKDRVVLEMTIPTLREHDTSKSFKLQSVQSRKFDFVSVMPKIIALKKAAEEAKNPKKKKKKKAKEGNDDDAKDDDEEEDEEDGEEKEEVAILPLSNLLDAWYTNRGSFLVSLDGADAGFVYECTFDMPEPTMWYPMHNESTVPITLVNYEPSREYAIFGAEDGTIRFHKVDDLTESMNLPLHDGNAGPLSCIKATFDRKHLISVGCDGNFFLSKVNLGGFSLSGTTEAIELAEIPNSVEDIKDLAEEGSYSIEEFKQKSEQDKKVMTAEEKKTEVRKEVRSLRRAFEKLLKENKAKPEAFQLGHKDFELDPQFAIDTANVTKERADLLSSELAWTLEKHNLAHQQLRKRYVERLKYPRFTVKCIGENEQVSTYRLIETSQEFNNLSKNIMAAIGKMKVWGMRSKSRQATESLAEGSEQVHKSHKIEDSDKEERELRERIELAKTGLRPDQAERIEAQILRSEEKRKKRAARKKQAEDLEAHKPDKESDNPGDLKEIKHARENMGDYKLKTAGDFTVRPEERINTTKKRNQIIRLRQQIYDAKSLFNSYVSRLRDQKLAAIESIGAKRGRLIEILQDLGESDSVVPSLPTTDSSEFPERNFEYTRESLLAFKVEYARILEEEKKAAKAKAGGGGGFGGLGGGGGDKADEDAEESESEDEDEDTGVDAAGASADGNNSEEAAQVTESPWALFSSIDARCKLKLRCEKVGLFEDINAMIAEFDSKVLALLHAKRDTEVKIKYAEHNHIMYYRELVHLKVFDQREKVIEDDREAKLNELNGCVSASTDTEKRHVGKKKLIAQLKADEKEVNREFQDEVNDNKFEKFLSKVYKKKIKKKKVLAEGEEDDSDDESSSDDDSDYDSDESDDSDFDDTVPLPGCDQGLFDRVIAMRDRRLNATWDLEDETKLCDQLRKETDILQKKEKTLRQTLADVEHALAEFQREKQAKLNKLDTGVPLRLGQIHYCTTKAIPADLTKALIFDTRSILGLKDRINQLEGEKLSQKEEYKTIKMTQRRLTRERKEKQAEIDLLDLKCRELQFLKFGALIDLEALEKSDMNPVGVELRAKLRKLERESARRVQEADNKIVELKADYVDCMRQNTGTRHDIVDVSKAKKVYETTLRKGQTQMFVDHSVRQDKQRKEMDDLQKLSQLQAHEIQRLRSEIEALGKKSGHVVPPSKAPRRPLPSIAGREAVPSGR